MNSGVYAACSGLMARMQALDTVSSNLSNSSSAGFEGEKDAFGTVLRHAGAHGLSTLNKAVNMFSVLGGAHLDHSQGAVERTDNTLDAAIQGPGYFKVQTSTGVAYTRSGNFQLDTQGRLSTSTGDLVLGDSGPITVGPGAVTIGPDGTVTSDGAICGKLALASFAPGVDLLHKGGGEYSAPAGATEISADNATIQQGALEGSNVDPTSAVVQMISAQRAAESMRHALTLLDTDMNKTAVQDLARVS